MTGVRHHFGAWLCAYVDGELTGPQASRVHSHLATCAACSAEVAAQLDARQIVAAAPVEPAPDLADRILAAVPREPVGAGDRPARRAPGERATPHARSRQWRRTTALGLSAAAAGVTGVLVLGGSDGYRPDTSRGASLQVIAGAPTTVARTDLVAGGDWVMPTRMNVAGASFADGDRRLVLRLESSAGHVVVEERRGRLDAAALAGASVLQVGDVAVHVLESDPWHAVWEIDGTIIEAYGDEDVRIRDVVEGLTHD
ncbi:hypothetical protein GCM10011331_03490 [Flavimobilis marinus]|uniref:Putative zinc-finger n=1 Tax=Flavimobilis marinus TaxID=285351 RepID=A0A1I2DPC3_9MICO|nr:zf-HC2 domain-containing protein [Flavimobilis marinus]GHG44698.1 hypothetical protein GCM10011331_03490 [Flavimobilis marinus]SFE82279.1 Putative zinc-finger [Flavimobilis marinus]